MFIVNKQNFFNSSVNGYNLAIQWEGHYKVQKAELFGRRNIYFLSLGSFLDRFFSVKFKI